MIDLIIIGGTRFSILKGNLMKAHEFIKIKSRCFTLVDELLNAKQAAVCQVMFFLFKHMHRHSQALIVTQQTIKQYTGLGSATISRALKRLEQENVYKIPSGTKIIAINPAFASKIKTGNERNCAFYRNENDKYPVTHINPKNDDEIETQDN